MAFLNTSEANYNTNEYLLIITPSDELNNKIMSIKKEFGETYKIFSGQFLKTQITLAHFTQLEIVEERLITHLKAITMGVAPFKIELRNYGSLPSHTIYINVTSKLPVKNLVKEIKEAQGLMNLNKENKVHFIEEPQITIARKLKPWQYERGWLEYSHKEFTGRFIAENMFFLKRKQGNKNAYQILKKFEFLNLPVTTKQGNLFI